MPDVDPRALLGLLAETVREAGRLALSMQTPDLRSWTKGESSPVSDADLAADRLIRDRLHGATPDFGWLSEESEDDPARLAKRHVWIVDPIDGTRAFLAGRVDWCVSVALVDHGQPALAAAYAPATDELFLAAKGDGATCNGERLRATDGEAFDIGRMAGPKFLIEKLLGGRTELAPHPRIGSLALRLCRVADGGLDLAFAGGASHDWDIAAADLIVHEAGGRLTGLTGDPLRYNRTEVTHDTLVAAGAVRHATAIARMGSRRR